MILLILWDGGVVDWFLCLINCQSAATCRFCAVNGGACAKYDLVATVMRCTCIIDRGVNTFIE